MQETEYHATLNVFSAEIANRNIKFTASKTIVCSVVRVLILLPDPLSFVSPVIVLVSLVNCFRNTL